jgi:hypothetical protein
VKVLIADTFEQTGLQALAAGGLSEACGVAIRLVPSPQQLAAEADILASIWR